MNKKEKTNLKRIETCKKIGGNKFIQLLKNNIQNIEINVENQ
jgi:hypothetical protein